MIGRLNGIVYSQERYLQHSSQAPRSNYTPPGERLFADPPNSPCPHTVPTSHPESATSPFVNSSLYRPSFIPKAGEEHNHWGEPSLPLEASRPPEGPLYTSPYHSPSRRTGDDTHSDSGVAGSPLLGSLLRVLRGVAAPPLVSLPPSKVHGSTNWYAPSNLTVPSEILMLRYQVRQPCR